MEETWPVVNMGFIGDSTIIRLREWLSCWPKSHVNTPGAIRLSPIEAHHFKPSTNLYTLTDFALEEGFRGCDIVIIKTQIDLFETWISLSNTNDVGEALQSIILDIRFLIKMIRQKNTTASIIIEGMNPVNIRLLVPKIVETDAMATDFAASADVLMQDLVRDSYDCSFISVVEVAKTAGICERVPW